MGVKSVRIMWECDMPGCDSYESALVPHIGEDAIPKGWRRFKKKGQIERQVKCKKCIEKECNQNLK